MNPTTAAVAVRAAVLAERGVAASARRGTCGVVNPRERSIMERNPEAQPTTDGDDLFGDPDNVDGSIEEDLDARLQAEQDEDDDDL
jgi:hypothetical protein